MIIHLYLVSKSRIRGAISPIPLFAFMAWCSVKKMTGTTLPLLEGGEWSASHPCCFISEKRAPGTHRIGGLMGPRFGLDVMAERKCHCFPCRELNPRRPVRSLATILTELPWLLLRKIYIVDSIHNYLL
jgi:hypothetical protein